MAWTRFLTLTDAVSSGVCSSITLHPGATGVGAAHAHQRNRARFHRDTLQIGGQLVSCCPA